MLFRQHSELSIADLVLKDTPVKTEMWSGGVSQEEAKGIGLPPTRT
jgi:hypothetical protein